MAKTDKKTPKKTPAPKQVDTTEPATPWVAPPAATEPTAPLPSVGVASADVATAVPSAYLTLTFDEWQAVRIPYHLYDGDTEHFSLRKGRAYLKHPILIVP